MKLIDSKDKCSGCEMCVSICPRNAISMKEDQYGFLYPCIDEKKCVDCGMCKKLCAFQNEEKGLEPQECYAAVAKNVNIKESASGGIFSSLAVKIIEMGGIVFGTTLEYENGKFFPKHISVDRIEDLYKIKGSKYVHSSMGDVYKEIKLQLATGRLVLFSGTPCQVAGVKSFLGKRDYDNLLLADIICHGVPSAKFFNDYIEHLNKKYNIEITDYKFRDKSKGWGMNARLFYRSTKGVIKDKILASGESSYFHYFLKSYTYRENCYYCKYANGNRVGDITIGDYWGVAQVHPEIVEGSKGVFKERDGISCVLVNTDKAKIFLKRIGDGLVLYPSEFKNVALYNEQLVKPCTMSEKRELILKTYENGGYEEVEKVFKKDLLPRFLFVKLKKVLSPDIKNKIKRIIKRRR